MARVLLIKYANTKLKTVGDLVGVFDDKHVFSDDEYRDFTIKEMSGISRQELVDMLNAKWTETTAKYPFNFGALNVADWVKSADDKEMLAVKANLIADKVVFKTVDPEVIK